MDLSGIFLLEAAEGVSVTGGESEGETAAKKSLGEGEADAGRSADNNCFIHGYNRFNISGYNGVRGNYSEI